MLIQPATRISQVQEYYFSRKLREIELMNTQDIPVINLGIGNPDLPPSESTIQALCTESSKENVHGYQSYKGIPALRKAFANWYKQFYQIELNFDDEILPLMGSKEGIMHISMAFLNPGDEVLVPNPGYPTYESATKLAGGKVRYYDLLESNGFYPDFHELNKTDLSKVKIMWVNYPHMPTGTPANMGIFHEIIDFGLKNNILICHDNPYSFILNSRPLSILSVPGAKDVALELNSLSKSHNMAGWRIGMVAGNRQFIKHILQVKSNMDSGIYLPLQLAAVEALKNDADWYTQLNQVYYQRKQLAYKIFNELECFYRDTQTGMFLWAKIPMHQLNAEAYSDEILNKARVFITPGSIFGSNGDKFLRISLCADEIVLNEALKRIKTNL